MIKSPVSTPYDEAMRVLLEELKATPEDTGIMEMIVQKRSERNAYLLGYKAALYQIEKDRK